MMNHRVAKNLHHLPDLRFAKWCEETYSINRGVYNTIDEKLYEAGYEDIRERRNAIIVFLEKHVAFDQNQSQKYFTFGPGNLSAALQQFSNQNFLKQ